ncbi:hypothetical protein Plhal703r1_c04g0022171 [Plasmopara halstedii]
MRKLGPLVIPFSASSQSFFINEGRYIFYRMVVYGNETVIPKLAQQLENWSKWSRKGGRVTASQRFFVFNTDIRVPDVAYTPRRYPLRPFIQVIIDVSLQALCSHLNC